MGQKLVGKPQGAAYGTEPNFRQVDLTTHATTWDQTWWGGVAPYHREDPKGS
jgi:hypothetical protein